MKFYDAFDKEDSAHAVALGKIMAAYKDINEESTFEKSHYEIAKMIPDYVDCQSYCGAVIRLYEANIEYLYAKHYIEDFNNKHRGVIAISIIFSGFVAIAGQLWFTLISGGLLYAYLSRKELRKSIDAMSFHEGNLYSIANLRSEIEKLRTLARVGSSQ